MIIEKNNKRIHFHGSSAFLKKLCEGGIIEIEEDMISEVKKEETERPIKDFIV